MGFWDFGGKCGLKGVASTQEQLPDGRIVTHHDPDNPAVLQDQFIAHALRTSRAARADFTRIFPTLLPEEQERLTELIEMNRRACSLLLDSQEFHDALQHAQITAGVRTRLTRGRRS